MTDQSQLTRYEISEEQQLNTRLKRKSKKCLGHIIINETHKHIRWTGDYDIYAYIEIGKCPNLTSKFLYKTCFKT